MCASRMEADITTCSGTDKKIVGRDPQPWDRLFALDVLLNHAECKEAKCAKRRRSSGDSFARIDRDRHSCKADFSGGISANIN